MNLELVRTKKEECIEYVQNGEPLLISEKIKILNLYMILPNYLFK